MSRYTLQLKPDRSCLEFAPRQPVPVQTKMVLGQLNAILTELPSVPTVGEILKEAIRREHRQDSVVQMVEVLYGDDRAKFYAYLPSKPTLTMEARDIRSHWNRHQWNLKTDEYHLLSEKEMRIRTWVDGRSGVDIDLLRANADVTNCGSQNLVIRGSMDLVPPEIAPVPGLNALLETEFLFRQCEADLGIDLAERPVQEPCRCKHDDAYFTAYRLSAHLKERSPRYLVFVSPTSVPPPTVFESLYQRNRLEGLSFADFLAFRAPKTKLAA